MVHPYIVFHGKCSEALEFYQKVFGCEIKSTLPYGDYIPDGLSRVPADLKDWVLHAEMEICGTLFWFADEANPVQQGNMVKLVITVPTAKEARHIFDKLDQEGIVTLPPTETFYSAVHAAIIDRFGVEWNVVAEETPNQ